MTVTTEGWVQLDNGNWVRGEDIRRVSIERHPSETSYMVTLAVLPSRGAGNLPDIYKKGLSDANAILWRDQVIKQLSCRHDVRVMGGAPECPDCGAVDPA